MLFEYTVPQGSNIPLFSKSLSPPPPPLPRPCFPPKLVYACGTHDIGMTNLASTPDPLE